MALTFDAKLARYADLAVRVGIGVRPGQRVWIRTSVDAVPFTRKLTLSAYRAGARLVDVMYGDEQLVRTRFEHAARDTFDEISKWQGDALNQASEAGDSFLSVFASDPDLLSDQDPALVGKLQQLHQAHVIPHTKKIMSNEVPWSIVAASVDPWAEKVFPDAPPGERATLLWEAIFRTCRADRDDPVAAWDAHLETLHANRDRLTARQYASLRFRGGGTDLTVGLPDDHVWLGGSSKTSDGRRFVANMPTEEVFTLPHRERVDGVVVSTKPLSYVGAMIEHFSLRFEGGRVVEARAKRGQKVLDQILETDDGARRLGEVALVPHGSPISKSRLLFYNTLFDENAASHVALGRAYSVCLKNGPAMSEDELARAGANTSLTHVDFMIGSGETDVDGVTKAGRTEAVMRAGEWAD